MLSRLGHWIGLLWFVGLISEAGASFFPLPLTTLTLRAFEMTISQTVIGPFRPIMYNHWLTPKTKGSLDCVVRRTALLANTVSRSGDHCQLLLSRIFISKIDFLYITFKRSFTLIAVLIGRNDLSLSLQMFQCLLPYEWSVPSDPFISFVKK